MVFSFRTGKSKNLKAKMVVDKDQLFYKTNHRNRGVAVIFNHETFKVPHLSKRNGTNADRNNLKSCLEMLGFNVIVHDDLNAKEVMENVEKCDYEYSLNLIFSMFTIQLFFNRE